MLTNDIKLWLRSINELPLSVVAWTQCSTMFDNVQQCSTLSVSCLPLPGPPFSLGMPPPPRLATFSNFCLILVPARGSPIGHPMGQPKGHPWVTHRSPMGLPWVSHGSPIIPSWVFHHSITSLPSWVSRHGSPMGLPWVSHGSLRSFPWVSHRSAMDLPWNVCGGPCVSHGDSVGRYSRGYPMG